MNLFRSEEHVARWLVQNGHTEPGATITAQKVSELAHAWWGNRLAADWRPRTREESQSILDSLALTGPYWQLAG
jgi:hypothetical protein